MIKKNNASIVGLLAVCALVFWAAFYPGFMSPDSISQFDMSKSLHFTDWHPPIMSWIWSVAGFFFPGPSGMLALHMALVWMSVYIWWDSYKERRFSWLILTIPFFPWILNFAGVLWKDVGLAFSLFALSGLALRKATPGRLFLALVLAFYSINLRYNAIFAVFPILILLNYRWLTKFSRTKAMIISCATIFVCIVLGGIFNYSVLEAQKTEPSKYMMVDDLAYLSIKSNKSLLPGISIEEIRECGALELGENKLVGKVFCLSTKPGYKRFLSFGPELKSVWLENITQSPIEYFQFRMAAFSYLLRKPSDPPYYIWQPGIEQNSLGIKQVPNGLTLIAEKFVQGSAAVAPFFFKPYWWLLSSLLLLVLTLLLANTNTVVAARALLISSIFYIAGYVPATPMADFRYIYWSVIATTISFIIVSIDWPGRRAGLSKRRVVVVSALMVLCVLVIVNHGRFLEIDVDRVLYDSLDGKRISVEDPVMKSDVIDRNGAYEIKGADPFLIYDVSLLNLSSKDARWLKFNFSCSGLSATPELRLFWWGDQQKAPVEAQSTTQKLAEGINLIPLEEHLKSEALSRLQGIRLDLENPAACKEITFKKIEFIK